MDPDVLLEAVKDAQIYSDIMNIKSLADDGLIFSSVGELGEMNYELGIEDLIEANLEETSMGAYSITFLKAILKLNSITEELEISLLTDNPLKMVFKLLEGGGLDYLLAPRVDREDYDEQDDLEEIYYEKNEFNWSICNFYNINFYGYCYSTYSK